MPQSSPALNRSRLRALHAKINGFGHDAETGGYARMAFTAEDMAVREWFLAELVGEGLEAWRDPVGNVFGRWGPADGPCVLLGSHLDTVDQGGAFDGSAGVAVAFECLLALRDAGLTPSRAVQVVATADEEGRFGGMLGSQALVGEVTTEWLEAAHDSDGVRLVDAMREAGLAPERFAEACLTPRDVAAFLELHVEQGPRLERSRRRIGVATGVSGVCRLEVTLDGEANHSGTTPMDMRADAFLGLAEIGGRIAGLIAECGTDESRVTIGKVALRPNEPHTVAGGADFSVILRDLSADAMQALKGGFLRIVAEAAAAHRLQWRAEEMSWLDPVALDPALARLMSESADKLGYTPLSMPSGAGHDAQTMQHLCPSGLLFVPSRGGISHSPKEWTEWADIEAGAEVMLHTLAHLITAPVDGTGH